MVPIRCLVVEDEPLAAELLVGYVQDVPYLELAGSCPDALYALEVLQTESIDLLFLDIHLPKLKGLEFLRSLAQPPAVILTTAYHEYALEAFELSVVDYLMKPIAFDRFLQAVEKVRLQRTQPAAAFPPRIESAPPPPHPGHRFFTVGKRQLKVFLRDIIYLESEREYVRIHTSSQHFLTKYPLSQLAGELGEAHFLRIHRSFLVAKAHIKAYSASEVEVADKQLPIGRSYQELVRQVLREL